VSRPDDAVAPFVETPLSPESRLSAKRSVSIFRKRLRKFRSIRRGYYSFLILLVAYGVSFFLPLLVNSTALVVHYQGKWYFPIAKYYGAGTFGQETIGEPDYRALAETLRQQKQGNWALMPFYPYSPTESLLDLPGDPPNPPSRQHIFGTDDRGRDIFARLAYGFNVSLSFALLVLGISLVTGVTVGATLGYFGGKVDILG